eukprot:superscaffoldBa00005937_g20958
MCGHRRERARRARDKTCGRENAAAPLLASFRPPPKGLNTRGAPRQREQQQPEEPSPTAAGAASDPGPIFTQFSVGEAGQGGGLGARAQKNERAENMNGAVYISFFQGQLESVLEQVVQLAVQEISKSVGSSLNALLLETAVKEQEIHRLRLQLQSRENRGRGGAADGGGSAAPGKNKAGERADSGRTKPEQQQQLQLHAPGGQGIEPGVPTDTRRLEQRGRVVDVFTLKPLTEQVYEEKRLVEQHRNGGAEVVTEVVSGGRGGHQDKEATDCRRQGRESNLVVDRMVEGHGDGPQRG